MDVNDSPTVDKLGSGENQSTPDPANMTTDTTNTTADKKNTTTDYAIVRPDATNTSPSESEETTRGRKMKAKNEEVIDEAIRAQINQLSGGNGKSAGRRNWRRNEKSESRSTQSLADENDPGGGEKTFDFPKQVNNNARGKNKKKEETIQSTAESYYSTISDDDVEQNIQRENAQALAATKNMVMLMEEGREAGYRTQGNLYSQGEKLKGVERDMDRVGEGLDEAEEDLDEMDGKSGCCGTGKKKKQKEKRSEANKKSKKLKYKKMGDGDEYQERDAEDNFHYVTGDAQERQMAANLGLVGDILDEMDLLADDMNVEIKGQNKAIDRIQTKGKENQKQLERVNNKAAKIANGKGAKEEQPSGGIVGAAMGM